MVGFRKIKDINKVIFRNDDVLLSTKGLRMTGSMKTSLRSNTFFGHFKEMDKIFEKYSLLSTLTILADGIEHNPDWIQYIKERKHRFTIELHGYDHRNYIDVSAEEGYVLLKDAKERIEQTFNTKVTRWYPPFSKLGFTDWGPEVCEKLGIGYNNIEGYYTINLHYWNTRDRNNLTTLLQKYYGF